MLTYSNAIVFTPTKSGTMSLEAALKQFGWQQRMPRHASKPLAWMDGSIRAHLILRNPFARLKSMYTYGILKNHPTLVRFAETDDKGFTGFLKGWLDNFHSTKRNHDWTMRYVDYFNALAQDDRVAVITTHRIEDGVTSIVRDLTGQSVAEIVKNTSAERVNVEAVWTVERVELVQKELLDDCQMGGYTLPECMAVTG